MDARKWTETMEPIDHPPGHEIERLNREIEEQYADAEWTPASGTRDMLSALPGVASCAGLWSRTGALDSVSQGNRLGFRIGSAIPASEEMLRDEGADLRARALGDTSESDVTDTVRSQR